MCLYVDIMSNKRKERLLPPESDDELGAPSPSTPARSSSSSSSASPAPPAPGLAATAVAAASPSSDLPSAKPSTTIDVDAGAELLVYSKWTACTFASVLLYGGTRDVFYPRKADWKEQYKRWKKFLSAHADVRDAVGDSHRRELWFRRFGAVAYELEPPLAVLFGNETTRGARALAIVKRGLEDCRATRLDVVQWSMPRAGSDAVPPKLVKLEGLERLEQLERLGSGDEDVEAPPKKRRKNGQVVSATALSAGDAGAATMAAGAAASKKTVLLWTGLSHHEHGTQLLYHREPGWLLGAMFPLDCVRHFHMGRFLSRSQLLTTPSVAVLEIDPDRIGVAVGIPEPLHDGPIYVRPEILDKAAGVLGLEVGEELKTGTARINMAKGVVNVDPDISSSFDVIIPTPTLKVHHVGEVVIGENWRGYELRRLRSGQPRQFFELEIKNRGGLQTSKSHASRARLNIHTIGLLAEYMADKLKGSGQYGEDSESGRAALLARVLQPFSIVQDSALYEALSRVGAVKSGGAEGRVEIKDVWHKERGGMRVLDSRFMGTGAIHRCGRGRRSCNAVRWWVWNLSLSFRSQGRF